MRSRTGAKLGKCCGRDEVEFCAGWLNEEGRSVKRGLIMIEKDMAAIFGMSEMDRALQPTRNRSLLHYYSLLDTWTFSFSK